MANFRPRGAVTADGVVGDQTWLFSVVRVKFHFGVRGRPQLGPQLIKALGFFPIARNRRRSPFSESQVEETDSLEELLARRSARCLTWALPQSGDNTLELKDIKAIIDLMKKNDLAVFKLEKEGFKLELEAHRPPAPLIAAVPSHQVVTAAPVPSLSTHAPVRAAGRCRGKEAGL